MARARIISSSRTRTSTKSRRRPRVGYSRAFFVYGRGFFFFLIFFFFFTFWIFGGRNIAVLGIACYICMGDFGFIY